MAEALRPSSVHKRAAVLAAAETVFLRDGYATATMDEVAALSGISKQTAYRHFGSKEALFVALVSELTGAASDEVHRDPPEPRTADELRRALYDYADRQLAIVLTPRLLRLRRLVIGEVDRFPELARVLWQHGPQRAMDSLAAWFDGLARRGLLRIDDPARASEQFNWLVMSAPLNKAMLLGDDAVPGQAERRAHLTASIDVFLAAYGPSEP